MTVMIAFPLQTAPPAKLCRQICKMSVDTCSHYGRSRVTQRTVDRNTLIAEAPLATRFAFVPRPHAHTLTFSTRLEDIGDV